MTLEYKGGDKDPVDGYTPDATVKAEVALTGDSADHKQHRVQNAGGIWSSWRAVPALVSGKFAFDHTLSDGYGTEP